METVKVHSQSEFDAIPKDFDGLIVIEKVRCKKVFPVAVVDINGQAIEEV